MAGVPSVVRLRGALCRYYLFDVGCGKMRQYSTCHVFCKLYVIYINDYLCSVYLDRPHVPPRGRTVTGLVKNLSSTAILLGQPRFHHVRTCIAKWLFSGDLSVSANINRIAVDLNNPILLVLDNMEQDTFIALCRRPRKQRWPCRPSPSPNLFWVLFYYLFFLTKLSTSSAVPEILNK